jgi:hypothetical protein
LTLARNGATTSNQPAKLSWGLDEIAKLSKAKVDESVILAFIENSETAYNPTSQDIIQLRELGVSSQIITALMRHGEGLRQTARESQKQVQTEQAAAVAAAPAPATTQPTTVYNPPATYAAPVSTVTYIGYPRYDTYPNYNYGYCYPGSYYYPRYYGYGYYPRFSLGVHFGGGHYGGYYGGRYGGRYGGYYGRGGHCW